MGKISREQVEKVWTGCEKCRESSELAILD